MTKVKIRQVDEGEIELLPELQPNIVGDSLDADTIYDFMAAANCMPHVLLVNQTLTGYNFYVLHNKVAMIEWLAVLPSADQWVHAKRMIQEVQRSMPVLRRRIIGVVLREDNLPAQVLFRECGFVWCRTVQRPDSPSDYYVMKYEAPKPRKN